MKRTILLLLMFVFSLSIKAQTPIQEFNFNYTLSNTQNDISFSGNVRFVKDRTGAINRAIRINNTSLEATITNLPLSNFPRTVSIWVKYNDVAVPNYIWGYGSLADTQYFGLLQQSATDSSSDLNLSSWGATNDVIVNTTISVGIWYNYTVTYDGVNSKIYRNGELIKSSNGINRFTSARVFSIGKMGSAISINADIDDLKIYNRALSDKEVALLYDNNVISTPNDDGAKSDVSKEVKTGALKTQTNTNNSEANVSDKKTTSN